jgi:hypothetical protein
VEEKLFDCPRGVREEILAVLGEALAARPEVVFAYAYGSFLEDRPFHDIDVGVYVKAAEQAWAGSLALDLGMAVESALVTSSRGGEQRRFPVDVRVLNWAPVSFCYHVLQGRLLFSRAEDVRVRWAERVLSRYLDLKPLRHRALKEAMTSWE